MRKFSNGRENLGFENEEEKESKIEIRENIEKLSSKNDSQLFMNEIEISHQQRKFSRCEKKFKKLKDFLSNVNFIHWCTLVVIGVSIWCILYSVAGSGFAPNSQLFSILALFVLAFIGGEIVNLIKLPPLLGMLLVGLLLRNVGFVHFEGVYVEITATLREIALCIILIRAGLGLDPTALKSLKYVILRLASVPGFVEGVITATVTHFVLGLPLLWGALAGAILAAVSPAVVIPCLFSLQERGFGTGKGIPTLVVAAASLDDIIAITAFGVVLNVIYSSGTSFTMQIFQGPLGILIGILFGLACGYVCQKIPHQKDSFVIVLRVLMTLGGGLVSIFGSKAIGFQGAGPLGCIIIAFVACLGWRKQGYSEDYNPVAKVYKIIWVIFQPILFGLVGAEVDVTVLELSMLGNCALALFCSLLGRIGITILVAFGAGFNWKEKIFVSLAWFPKATVQAALGPLALDKARQKGSDDEIEYGRKILILAVLAILITAPIGAALITTLGPKLLDKVEKKPTTEETTDGNIQSRFEIENDN